MPKHPLYHLLFVLVGAGAASALRAAAATTLFMGPPHGYDGADDGTDNDRQYDNSTHSTSLIELFATDGCFLHSRFSYDGPKNECQKYEGYTGP